MVMSRTEGEHWSIQVFFGCPETPLAMIFFLNQWGDTPTGTDLHQTIKFAATFCPPPPPPMRPTLGMPLVKVRMVRAHEPATGRSMVRLRLRATLSSELWQFR